MKEGSLSPPKDRPKKANPKIQNDNDPKIKCATLKGNQENGNFTRNIHRATVKGQRRQVGSANATQPKNARRSKWPRPRKRQSRPRTIAEKMRSIRPLTPGERPLTSGEITAIRKKRGNVSCHPDDRASPWPYLNPPIRVRRMAGGKRSSPATSEKRLRGATCLAIATGRIPTDLPEFFRASGYGRIEAIE